MNDDEIRRGARESRARWRAANPERKREYDKQWRAEHLERSRQINRESARRAAARAREVRQQQQEAARREEERRRRADAQRQKNLAKLRAWERDNPDRVREARLRWEAANPEKVRARSARYYERNKARIAQRSAARRDSDPEGTARRSRESRRLRDGRAESRRRREDPEAAARMLQQNRDAKRLKRRIASLGLPPRRVHRTTAAERRANERAVDWFFSSDQARVRHMQYAFFHDALDRVMTLSGDGLRARARAFADARRNAGLTPVDVEENAYARAVGIVIDRHGEFDQLGAGDVRQAVQAVRELHDRRAHDAQAAALREQLTEYVRAHRKTLRRDAALENQARVQVGKQPVRSDMLVYRIAFDAIKHRLSTDRLSAAEMGKIINVVRERHPALFDPVSRRPVVRYRFADSHPGPRIPGAPDVSRRRARKMGPGLA